MKKKKMTIILTSYITAAFLVLGGFMLRMYRENIVRERYIRHNYQHAFSELVSAMEDVDAALQKCVYATSPSMISAVCTQVYGKATAAEMAMGELPNSCYELETTSSFITKVGDYAYALSRNASNGEGYTDEEYRNLLSLSKSASLLSDNLIQMYGDMQSGSVSIGELSRTGYLTEQAGESTSSFAGLSDGFKMIETEFPEIPSLIYDGPFSDHISDREPEMLKGAEAVTEKQALDIAARFTGLRSSSFTSAGAREGDLPVYSFTAGAYGGSVTVEVTKSGGYVSYYSNTRSIDESSISADSAVDAARSFLISRGYEDMIPTYSTLTPAGSP
jgi:germination protein YpeB